MYLVYTRYIPDIYFGLYVGIYQVYTRYILGLEITRYIPGIYLVYTSYIADIHLESCTPGQDWAKWYKPVCTSTYLYNMVQVSTRFPVWYKTVCTSTY